MLTRLNRIKPLFSRGNYTRFLAPTRKYFYSKDLFSASSVQYLEELERMYEKDPMSVPKGWADYFRSLKGLPQQVTPEIETTRKVETISKIGTPLECNTCDNAMYQRIRTDATHFVRAYQHYGHLLSTLDPLGLEERIEVKELLIDNYPLLKEAMRQNLEVDIGVENFEGFLDPNRPPISIRFLEKRLKEIYSSSCAYEFQHLDRKPSNWIRRELETDDPITFTPEERRKIFDKLAKTVLLEHFLGRKFPNTKRFGLEGAESMIPGVNGLLEVLADHGVKQVIVGMPHRGRLNFMNNIIGKPLLKTFSEFRGKTELAFGSGDVKYHMGYSNITELDNGSKIKISLLNNPSHLEAIDPVVEGSARAKQIYMNDEKREEVVSLLFHGDAAFAGQGVVYETMGLSGLKQYTTGGTIHIVVNNQIGFTTDPKESRSSRYCTDLAKFIGAPIFHVNADDPEAVVFVMRLAAKWNMTFKNDIVIDLICYRRHGHNEMDQPTYTHPIMYHAIYSKPNIMELYAKKLIEEKVIDQKYKDEVVAKYNALFDEEYQKSKSYKYRIEDWFAKKSSWRDFRHDDDINHITPTGVSLETLKHIGRIISGGNIPKHFVVHKNLQKILDARMRTIEEGKGIDWATAESLAIGSLLIEGTHVRFSGQDVQRGTFSQRHAVIHDQKTNEQFTPLATLSKNQAVFQICNSSLSEYGILGYEYGYSIANPYSLVIWEAQFGDFANGAQVIIDQFVSSGETKWLRQSGLVMLLPHGYEGMGPEHSSGRIERFLQLSDDDPDDFPENFNPKKQIQERNWQICNITTPANFFHVLRRQIHRFFRKPLVVFTPKFLLRYKYATSDLAEMGPDTQFQRVYGETNSNMVPDDQVKRVIFCTGKIYYTLWVNREEMANKKNMKLHDIAIIRLEQLFPFPFDKVHEYCMKYKNAEIVWAQEEPKNMGAWTFVYFRILTSLRGPKSNPTNDPRIPSFVGRPPSASPATGYPEIHAEEEKAIIQSALAHYYS